MRSARNDVVLVKPQRWGDPPPGALDDTCASCGCPVWLTPFGARFHAQGVRLQCADCALPTLPVKAGLGRVHLVETRPGTWHEFLDAVREREAEVHRG